MKAPSQHAQVNKCLKAIEVITAAGEPMSLAASTAATFEYMSSKTVHATEGELLLRVTTAAVASR